MKKQLKRAMALLTAICLLSVMCACGNETGGNVDPGNDGEKITVTIGTVLAETHPLQQLVYYFQDEVDKIIPGRIEWKNFINSALGGERDLGENMLAGTLEGAVIGCTSITPVAPMAEVLLQDCPFLFRSGEQLYEAMDDWYGEVLDNAYAEYDMVNMAYMNIGGQELENTARAIVTPADMKGLKIRTYESKGPYGFLEACGALPISMDFGEVYTAVQQGTIDGLFTSSYAFVPQKFTEVTKYHTVLGVTHCSQAITFSKSWFESLPEDVQAAFIQAGENTEEYCRYTVAPAQDEADYQAIADAGVEVTYLTDEQYNAFKDITAEYCWDEFRQEIGDELWNTCMEWLESNEAE